MNGQQSKIFDRLLTASSYFAKKINKELPFVSSGEKPSTTDKIIRPLLISGPSGGKLKSNNWLNELVGKSTLIKRLLEELPEKFELCVSHTTRQPRPDEKDGVHYYFTTKEEMEKAIANGEFCESAEVHGNLYGTSFKAVQAITEKGKCCVFDVDVQGAQSIHKYYKDRNDKPVFIFITPPSIEELKQRLEGRYLENSSQ